MKYKVLFKVYVSDYDLDPSTIAEATVWMEKGVVKMRIEKGDPYFVYNCAKEVNLQREIERRSKKRRIVGESTTSIIFYISRSPELFVMDCGETSRLPPKYRFSSFPRHTADDESGLEPTGERLLQDLIDRLDPLDYFAEDYE